MGGRRIDEVTEWRNGDVRGNGRGRRTRGREEGGRDEA